MSLLSGGDRSTYTPGRSPGQGTSSGGRGGECGVAPDPEPVGWVRAGKGVNGSASGLSYGTMNTCDAKIKAARAGLPVCVL